MELLNSHVASVSQFGGLSRHPPEDALDGDHNTIHHTSGSGIHFLKFVFKKRIFIQKIKLVDRPNCCPERGDNLDIKTTVINSGSRTERICANTGTLGGEKILDCNEYADELEIFRDVQTLMNINLADVYFYGATCFV